VCSEPVDLLVRTSSGEDEYGDETVTETPTGTLAYIDALLRQQFEDTVSTTQETSDVRVYLAPDVTPSGYDALRRADGRVYEFLGPPVEAMRGWPPQLQHYELRARLVS
jgi:hypothetical protein